MLIDKARGVMGIQEIGYRVDRILVGKGIPGTDIGSIEVKT
jgi:hypothetical protein